MGDIVPTSGGQATVVGLAWKGQLATVYNFGVEQTRSYFVGETGAWVHNCIKDIIEDLPDELFEINKCKECSDKLVKALKDKDISGKVIDFRSKNDFMVYDDYSMNASITKDGTHRAVEVDGVIYDNLNRDGVPREEYLEKIHGVGLETTETDF